MLIQLQRHASSEDTSADPAHLLLDCHERIRRFVDIALKLPDAAATTTAVDLADAARRLRRYFTEALPLHAQDEDDSLTPRLLAGGCDDAVRDALAVLATEHEAIHALVAELAPRWSAVIEQPAQLAALADDLRAGAQRLHALFEVHLAREEALVFPAVRALDEGARRAIVSEMRARRPM